MRYLLVRISEVNSHSPPLPATSDATASSSSSSSNSSSNLVTMLGYCRWFMIIAIP
jgi:hypothetical protein